MAINDINIISPVESSQNIIISRDKKQKKKKEKKLRKPRNNAEQLQDTSENDQHDIMVDNDKHLLDFKA